MRFTRDWLELTETAQVLAELDDSGTKYIQDIVVCNSAGATGVNVEIFIEKKTESTLNKPTFDPSVTDAYKTQGLVKGGFELNSDYVIKAKLTGAASGVYARTLF